jgi:hypothetical protein
MAERTPPKQFGQRRPAAAGPAEPVKRSGHVALLLMGTLAVGGGAYALMPRQSCEPSAPGMAAPALPQSDARCGSGGSSGGGGHGGSSRLGFSGDSSGGSASAGSSESASGGATRGGFGALAHAFGFSGGG